MLLILYGLPGAGKNYAGHALSAYLNAHFHDADHDLTAEMRHYIANRLPLTDSIRDRFYAVVGARIAEFKAQHPHLIVAQALIRERHRTMLRKRHREANFILIEAPRSLRMERLASRGGHTVSRIGPSYADVIEAMFERPPNPPHIINDAGPECIIE